jgi:hypothetical protein
MEPEAGSNQVLIEFGASLARLLDARRRSAQRAVVSDAPRQNAIGIDARAP